jgi:restriction system protein
MDDGSPDDPWGAPIADAPGGRREPAFGTPPSRAISRWNLELLRALEWKRFEIVSARYFEAIGFKTRRARAGADGGVDIHLYAKGADKPGILVQCKAWNVYRVGIKPVRELFGVMAHEGISEGIFLTTGTYTDEARAFTQGPAMHLWDGEHLLSQILALPEDKRRFLLDIATEGDFRTPTCPSCDIKMIARANKKDHEQFWGCRNYPRCRQTFKVKK